MKSLSKDPGCQDQTRPEQASQSGWIHISQLANSAQLTTWRNQYSLGAGELSTILLAKEIQADVAMIDERGARLLAQSEGVPVLGTVGLLELGYRSGEVTDLRLVGTENAIRQELGQDVSVSMNSNPTLLRQFVQ